MLFQQLSNLGFIGMIGYLMSLVIALTIHEYAHAWMANRLGDPTPRLQGRLTLSPLAHLDPIGSLLLLFGGFGWGKPVFYNPMFLKRRQDELLIALAGPASNILMAFGAYLLLYFVPLAEWGGNVAVIQLFAELNLFLAAFNLVPIPPLDGSAIVAYFYKPYKAFGSSPLGLIILIGSIITGLAQTIMTPIFVILLSIVTIGGKLLQ
jgi:Zn-dependent protease